MIKTNKIIQFDTVARERLLDGVNILANAVKITMGPRGQNVIIEQPVGSPILTKDGVTVAKAVNLKEQFDNLGVQIIKEAASRTADVAGDGTTTATVLSQSIFSEGVRMLAAGFQSSEIKKGIDAGVEEVINNLKAISVKVTSDKEIEDVGTISANGESEIGRLLVEAINAVGRDGVITVEEAKGFDTTLTTVEGMKIERGYLSPYFINNQDKMISEVKNPLILLCNTKILNLKEIMPLLEQVLDSGRPLFVIADDVDGDAMQGLVVNHLKGTLQSCAIKAPGFGENRVSILQDLSILLDCQIVSNTTGISLKDVTIEDLGTCKRIVCGKSETVFVGCSGDNNKIKERISSIKERLKSSAIQEAEVDLLKDRISKLSGGVAILRVGGATEVELGERKDRVDDALHSTQAAIEEGILPGGGVALVRASQSLECHNNDKMTGMDAGIQIVKRACCEPLRQIVINSGGTPDVVLDKVMGLKDNFGYNAATDQYGDMMTMGIIDPLKVVRTALENASSAASMMLTVGCTMVEDEEVIEGT
jgi:chaperonin GroEL